MSDEERARKLEMFSTAIKNNFTDEQISEGVSQIAGEVKSRLSSFLSKELIVLFNARSYSEEDIIKNMSSAMVDIIDIACSIPEIDENRKQRASIMFKIQVMFKAASDYFKAKYCFTADCQKFEYIIKDCVAMQNTLISTLMLKKFFPNEDIDLLFPNENDC